MKWILAAVIVLAVLVAAVFGIAYYLYRMAISRKGVRQKERPLSPERRAIERRIREGGAWFWKQNPEFLSIRSRDGLKLYGYFLSRPDAVRTVVCVHGYRASPDRDFGAQTRFLYENGCNLLLVDQRAHGRSEGRAITYGIRERYDVEEWMAFLQTRIRPEQPVYLYGISMGCATVLMASSLSLAGNLRGIVADCGFTSPYDIFRHILTDDMHLPEFPILPAADVFARRLGGFSMKEYSTLDAMRVSRTPVLFIHGADDRFVPTRMSRENFDVCAAEKELWIVEGAAHAESWFIDTDGYRAKLSAFFEKHDKK